jgi:proteasome lid subunit RPN8/RPN11
MWWLGRRIGDDTYVMSCVAPAVDSGPQHVFADESAVGDAAAAARRRRLGLVAQVHSHPGSDTRHSDGDDDLVLMPFEMMFSIVVADYGLTDIEPGKGMALHQYQDGRWVWITDAPAAFVLVPDEVLL